MHFASYGNPASSSKTFPHWSGSPLFSMRWWPQRYADIVVKYFACISLPGYSGFFGALVYKYATKLTGFFICLFVLFSTINIFPLNFLLCLIWLTLLIFVTLFHLCVFLCKCRSYVCMSVWLVMPYLNCIYISVLVYILYLAYALGFQFSALLLFCLVVLVVCLCFRPLYSATMFSIFSSCLPYAFVFSLS